MEEEKMITVLKEGATEEQRNQLISWFEEQGVQVQDVYKRQG